jgi:hydroxyacylglutathione hydrolase
MMIEVAGFILGSYPIRGFLAWTPGDAEGIFVDPGGWDDAILATAAQAGIRVGAILLTHGHWDHTEGLAEACANLRAPVYAHADDLRLLAQEPDVVLEGDEVLSCGSLAWRVIHLPGHTAGSVAYAAPGVAFVGDTLFAGSVGGTPTLGEFERERSGIRERLFILGDATRIYPAHGPATTIGIERRYNPFLR